VDIGLKDKRAIVTGGGSGIGRQICLTLAQEGAVVAIPDRDIDGAEETAALVREAGGVAVTAQVDVTDMAAVEAATAEFVQQLGGIDILINNAGIMSSGKKFLDMVRDEWDREIQICLYGVLNWCKAVLPVLVDGGGGAVVNIASDAGRVGEQKMAVYSAAKSGVIAFSKAVARELGPKGVRVNCVAPGTTRTPLAMQNRIMQDPATLEKVVRLYPLRRLGEPSDIANAVVYLASDAAGWVTGQTLSVSGGYSML
jgi:2-hydroxycyclohexanecarboxyl-CoA dehydrogenase